MDIVKKNSLIKLGIIGCGAQARYALEILNTLKFKGKLFIIDPIGKGKNIIGNFNVIRITQTKKITEFFKKNNIKYVHIALSDNILKYKLMNILEKNHLQLVSLISPYAIIFSTAIIEKGCMVNPLAVIGADSYIGKCCIIHSLVNIDHDCTINECSNIAPGVTLAGCIKVGKHVFIYTGANIAPDVKIGDFAVIGAGACVLKDVPPKTIVVGVPARIIKSK